MLLLQDSVRDMSASTVVRMLVQYDEQKTIVDLVKLIMYSVKLIITRLISDG